MTDRMPSRSWPRAPWLLALVAFAVLLGAYTRNNDFAFYYHPDESGKVGQVMRHWRNLHHPLLLLSTTELGVRLTGGHREPEHIVVVGRTVSAIFAALTVAALMVLAFELQGFAAALLVGLLAGLDDQLFEFAHYMKEDPALMVGFALSFLTLHFVRVRRTPASLAAVGVAAAVALSGKYVGVLILLVAIPVVIWTEISDERRGALSTTKRWQWFGLALLGALLVMNYSLLIHPAGLIHGVAGETSKTLAGHELPHAIPHAYYVQLFVEITPWIVQALALFHALYVCATARQRSLVEWLSVGFPIFFTAVLSCTALVSRRYFLPVSVMVDFAAALGAVELATLLAALAPVRSRGWLRVAVVGGLLILVGMVQWPTLVACEQGFGQDDHQRLESFIRRALPASAVIAQEERVGLPIPGRWEFKGRPPLPQRLLTSPFAPDLGSLAELRARGVDYVAICNQVYDRFFDPSAAPTLAGRELYEKRRDFYRTLLASGPPLWQAKPGLNVYLQPGLSLYHLSGKNPATEASPDLAPPR